MKRFSGVCLTILLAAGAWGGETSSTLKQNKSNLKPEESKLILNAPRSDYAVRRIEGWKVLVSKVLLEEHGELSKSTLKLLRHQLYQITRVAPRPALRKLRRIPIWVEYEHEHPCMCYHPSRRWLRENGYNPEKAGSVEVSNARNFQTWTLNQPWMVLHELAHGYHHKVLKHGNVEIQKAFRKAVEGKSYESVGHYSGKSKRHYALSNDMEYFAEASEAYFGANDFFPFVRSELQQHDPDGFRLMKKLWGD